MFLQNHLHKVATEHAGQALKDAVEKCGNKKMHVKCTTIDPEYANAIDIRYHKRCWAKHVHGVLCVQSMTDFHKLKPD